MVETSFFAVAGLVVVALARWWDGELAVGGWGPPLAIAAGIALLVLVVRWRHSDVPGWIVAGSHWAAAGRGRPGGRAAGRAEPVRLYDLTRIYLSRRLDSLDPLTLSLWNATGAGLHVDVALLEANPPCGHWSTTGSCTPPPAAR